MLKNLFKKINLIIHKKKNLNLMFPNLKKKVILINYLNKKVKVINLKEVLQYKALQIKQIQNHIFNNKNKKNKEKEKDKEILIKEDYQDMYQIISKKILFNKNKKKYKFNSLNLLQEDFHLFKIFKKVLKEIKDFLILVQYINNHKVKKYLKQNLLMNQMN